MATSNNVPDSETLDLTELGISGCYEEDDSREDDSVTLFGDEDKHNFNVEDLIAPDLSDDGEDDVDAPILASRSIVLKFVDDRDTDTSDAESSNVVKLLKRPKALITSSSEESFRLLDVPSLIRLSKWNIPSTFLTQRGIAQFIYSSPPPAPEAVIIDVHPENEGITSEMLPASGHSQNYKTEHINYSIPTRSFSKILPRTWYTFGALFMILLALIVFFYSGVLFIYNAVSSKW